MRFGEITCLENKKRENILGKKLRFGEISRLENTIRENILGKKLRFGEISRLEIRFEKIFSGRGACELEKKCNQPIPSPMYPKWSPETPKISFDSGALLILVSLGWGPLLGKKLRFGENFFPIRGDIFHSRP
eukprot:sb/3474944/